MKSSPPAARSAGMSPVLSLVLCAGAGTDPVR